MNTDNHSKTECEFKELTQMKSLGQFQKLPDQMIALTVLRSEKNEEKPEIICEVFTVVIY